MNINTIAKLSGYSKATVSRYIGNYGYVSKEAKEKIKKIIEKYNYYPSNLARSLVSGKTNTIGLILTDIVNPFYSILARSIEEVLVKNGYNLMICNSDESLEKEKKNYELLMEKNIDGLIISATVDMEGNYNEIFSEIKNFEIPVVFVDRLVPANSGFDTVLVDNYKGGQEAAKFLINLKHNKIGIITSKIPLPNLRDRERGFINSLKNEDVTGITYERIELGTRIREAEWGKYYHLFKDINKFTALFCTTNILNFYTLKILKNMGIKVPDDISIIGFDDFLDAEIIDPPPTVIAQPISDIGINTGRLILSKINKKSKSNDNIILPVKLIARQSTRNNVYSKNSNKLNY